MARAVTGDAEPGWVDFDRPYPFLTCPADGPHSHPVCPDCGAVRYGSIECEACRAYQREGATAVKRYLWLKKFGIIEVAQDHRLAAHESLTLLAIILQANERRKEWSGTLRGLAVDLNTSRTSTSRTMGSLQEKGVIKVITPFTRNEPGLVAITVYDDVVSPPPSQQKKRLSDRGVVYYAARPDGAIKIGFTTGHPEKRLKALSTAVEVRLLAWHRGGQKAEKALHRRFADLRLHGEWFSPEPELVSHIEHAARVGQERHPEGFAS